MFQVTMRSKGAFLGLIPTWTKVPSDLHSIDIDVDKPTKPVLTVDKNDHRDAAVIGDQLSYDIVVKNTGDATATNVAISDDLPAGLTGITASYTAGTSGQVTVSGQQVRGTIPSLAPGASSTLTVKATVGTSTPLGNLRNNACAVAASSNQACDGDETTIDKQTKPVLTITKDDQQGDVKLGQNLTYDIVVRNTGDGAAKSVVVSDPLPAGLDFVSGSGPAGHHGHGLRAQRDRRPRRPRRRAVGHAQGERQGQPVGSAGCIDQPGVRRRVERSERLRNRHRHRQARVLPVHVQLEPDRPAAGSGGHVPDGVRQQRQRRLGERRDRVRPGRRAG
ncbi:DUF11 domain-containing protein [Microbacterium oxydans]|nr:DUF11 domain-containing protein [Microbacterium oxydans]